MTRLAPAIAASTPRLAAIPETVDVLVVGAGQAGLAAGYHLRETGRSFVLVDGAARIGGSWRQRWDSLRLFTPAAWCGLPGLPFPGDPDAFPTKDEVADYLEAYARRFALPVLMGRLVRRLAPGPAGFRATLGTGETIDARAVVVAAGAFGTPAVPAIARDLDDRVLQLTSANYRNPGSVPDGQVLVVGDGATGRQIALDLASSHPVAIAGGKPRRFVPDRVLGRSVFWWLDRLGVLRAGRDSRIGRRLRATDPIPGRHLATPRLVDAGIDVRPRLIAAAGTWVTFADVTALRVRTVIWAAGYRDDTSWIAVPGALDGAGRIVEQGGLSPVPRLAYVGRSWQRTRASALLAGVGDDARLVVEAVVAGLDSRAQVQGLGERARAALDVSARPALGAETIAALDAGASLGAGSMAVDAA